MNEYEPYIVYANTGQEHPKTLEFIHNCEKHYGWNVTWLEAKINPEPRKGTRYNEVDFVTASLTGEPDDKFIDDSPCSESCDFLETTVNK